MTSQSLKEHGAEILNQRGTTSLNQTDFKGQNDLPAQSLQTSNSNNTIKVDLSKNIYSYTSAANADDNSNIQVGKEVEDSSVCTLVCVASSDDYVAKSKDNVAKPQEYIASPGEMRRISSLPPSIEVDRVESGTNPLLGIISRYAKVRIEQGRIHWEPDPNKQLHLVMWTLVNDHPAYMRTKRILRLVSEDLITEINSKSLTPFCCLVDASDNPQQLLQDFTNRLPGLSLRWSMTNDPLAAEMFEDIDKCVVPAARFAGYCRTPGAALTSKHAKMLWDDDQTRCLKKLIYYLSKEINAAADPSEVKALTRQYQLDLLFNDPQWSKQLERLCHQNNQAWGQKKFAKSPVFYGCFTTPLKELIPAAELEAWKRQKLNWDEIEGVLLKLTRTVLSQGGPVSIHRNYWKKAWLEAGPKLGRKMNNDKVGWITGLLVRYGFITKQAGHKKATIYGLGCQNPFADEGNIISDVD